MSTLEDKARWDHMLVLCSRSGTLATDQSKSGRDLGGCHSSVVSSATTILWPRVKIPSTPSMLLSICIIEIVTKKERK